MNELKVGDIVRRLSDGALMAVDYADESVVCCHFIKPVLPANKLFIATDALELIQLNDTDLSQL
jgi:hypothetical protein